MWSYARLPRLTGELVRSPIAAASALAIALAACSSGAGSRDGAAFDAATRELPLEARQVGVQARDDLVENSAAAMSARQPGVFFSINDSGNEPLLFALDTTGADRGAWRIAQATNVDWEGVALGPCARADSATVRSGSRACVYIADVGDNEERRPTRVIYRTPEPNAEQAGYLGVLPAERLAFRYADGPHDVEAMYVAPTGATYLITKRPRVGSTGSLRPALVFMIPASAWGRDTLALAELVDSLPIVPGSAPGRSITDASLAQDGRHLAVRTYAEVYVFASDPLTGRVLAGVPPARCNTGNVAQGYGEGITWIGAATALLLTREGRHAPLLVVRCPMPLRSTSAPATSPGATRAAGVPLAPPSA